jgi:hypothetical protein
MHMSSPGAALRTPATLSGFPFSHSLEWQWYALHRRQAAMDSGSCDRYIGGFSGVSAGALRAASID